MDNNTEITYTVVELAASGISSGDTISSFAFNNRSKKCIHNEQCSTFSKWSQFGGSHLPAVGLNSWLQVLHTHILVRLY